MPLASQKKIRETLSPLFEKICLFSYCAVRKQTYQNRHTMMHKINRRAVLLTVRLSFLIMYKLTSESVFVCEVMCSCHPRYQRESLLHDITLTPEAGLSTPQVPQATGPLGSDLTEQIPPQLFC